MTNAGDLVLDGICKACSIFQLMSSQSVTTMALAVFLERLVRCRSTSGEEKDQSGMAVRAGVRQ